MILNTADTGGFFMSYFTRPWLANFAV